MARQHSISPSATSIVGDDDPLPSLIVSADKKVLKGACLVLSGTKRRLLLQAMLLDLTLRSRLVSRFLLLAILTVAFHSSVPRVTFQTERVAVQTRFVCVLFEKDAILGRGRRASEQVERPNLHSCCQRRTSAP